MSDCLQPHGLQHGRPPCPPPPPWVCPSSSPLNHLNISSSATIKPSTHFFLCFLFSNELALHIRWPGASSLASVLPMNIQGWFPLGLTGWISSLSKKLSRVFSSTTIRKHQFFGAQRFLWSNPHIHTWALEKPYLWLYGALSAKWYLCFLICCLGLS